MKNHNVRLLLIFTVIFLGAIPTAEAKGTQEISVAIQRIRNRAAGNDGSSGDCFHNRLWASPGEAMREVLTDEFVKLGGNIALVERESLRDIYEDEYNQENLDESTVQERKKFIASNYAIAGVISEFEWCAASSEGSIDVGSLLGFNKLAIGKVGSKAHVAVDLRLIVVKTGRILKTVHAEGKVDDSAVAFSGDAYGVKLKLGSFDKTALGKAVRIAMADAAIQLHSEILTQQ